MLSLTVLMVLVVVMALLFDFVNGWNDSANAIATVVATRVLSPTGAVILASTLNLGGAMVGTAVAKTVAETVAVDSPGITPAIALALTLAGLLAAAIWAAAMTAFGMPISGSHSLVGGIIGAGVAAGGVQVLVTKNLVKTLLAMLIAPCLGFIVAYFAYIGLIWLTRRWKPSTMNLTFGKLQLVSASWMAWTHGTNDAQKVIGIITMALVAGGFQQAHEGAFHVQTWVKLACASAISLGTAAGGWKVIKTLGHHLTKLGPPEGFVAETAGAVVLSAAAALGVPTSTTHTITGSILGLGATRGMSRVRWGLGEKIILAWVFTLPTTIALGGVLFWLLGMILAVHA